MTVGGSGVGEPLLRRVLDAVPAARRMVPDLRFLVVAGPRIDPESLPTRRGRDRPRVRARPRPAPRRLRRRGRPGRADDVHGADRGSTPVRLRAAASPLRAEPARPPPPGAVRRRHAACRTSRPATRTRWPWRLRARSGGRSRTARWRADGAARAAAPARRPGLTWTQVSPGGRRPAGRCPPRSADGSVRCRSDVSSRTRLTTSSSAPSMWASTSASGRSVRYCTTPTRPCASATISTSRARPRTLCGASRAQRATSRPPSRPRKSITESACSQLIGPGIEGEARRESRRRRSAGRLP